MSVLLGLATNEGDRLLRWSWMEVPQMQAAVHIETTGPFCPKCDSLIESSLGALPGVVDVRAHFTSGLTSVLIDLDEVDAGALADEIRKCGFTARSMVLRPLERDAFGLIPHRAGEVSHG